MNINSLHELINNTIYYNSSSINNLPYYRYYQNNTNNHYIQYIKNIEKIHTNNTQNILLYTSFNNIKNPINYICPISLDTFENNTPVIKINKCNHIFSCNDLTDWLKKNNNCPLCRCDINNL